MHSNAQRSISNMGDRMKRVFAQVVFVFMVTVGIANADNGILLVDVAPFKSEIELKKKIQAQLESGGIEWGQTGNRIVFTTVNKRFINFDVNQFTRYGTQKSLELPAGDYLITCAGLVVHTAFSPEKILSKGGYFNENIVTAHVEAGKTTTLKIEPVIRKQNTVFMSFFMPDLLTSTILDGTESEQVSLNAQTDKSIKWDDYSGDLKFKAASKK